MRSREQWHLTGPRASLRGFARRCPGQVLLPPQGITWERPGGERGSGLRHPGQVRNRPRVLSTSGVWPSSHPERTSRAVLPPARGRVVLDRSGWDLRRPGHGRGLGEHISEGVCRAGSAGRRGGGPERGSRSLRRAGSAFPPGLGTCSGPHLWSGWTRGLGRLGHCGVRAPSSASSPGLLLGAPGPGTPGEIRVPRGRGYSRSRAP